ncbi:cytochrome P450 [Nonomuraea fuscirosea]|uniref:cytochrome P450 n=1 Tax=Nonomuraea fuscirosea TaxID=1291556 RepID=UPI003435463C
MVVAPREWFDEHREAGRVFWHESTGTWFVTRFNDVWDLLVDPRLGHPSQDAFIRTLTPEQRETCAALLDFAARWPVFTDPPEHTVARRLLLPLFSTEENARVAAAVRARVESCGPESWHGADPLDAVLRPACRAGLAALLCLAEDQLDQLDDWSKDFISFVSRTSGYEEAAVRRSNEVLERFRSFVVGECTEHTDSLIGRLLWRALRDGTLTEVDAAAYYAQILTGLIEPTTSALATAIELLGGDPGLRHCFDTDPDAFIGEVVRLTTPFHFVPRRALVPMDLFGHSVEEGARVVLLLVSANRDWRRFPDPLAFRMDRGYPPHIAFGRGRHACLGAAMATKMIKTILRVLVETAFDSRPTPTPQVQWRTELGMHTPLSITW